MPETIKHTRRRLHVVLWILASPAIVILWLWTVFALYYSNLPHPLLQLGVAGAFSLGSLVAFFRFPGRKRTLLVLFGIYGIVALWHTTLRPSNERDWHPEVAILPVIAIEGERITIEGVRHFVYHGSDDFDARYERRTFELSELQAVDLLVSYWGDEAIAHTMLSFDFGGDDVLCVSAEVRKERDESFHPLPGMFKQFELIYVMGDERDIIRVRTDHRDEDVYLFRTVMSRADGTTLLMRILRHADDLRERPVFYRTLLRNCTTAIVEHINSIWPKRTPYTEMVIMNGYAPRQAYEHGMLDSQLPFDELKSASRITAVALEHGESPGFSRAIRKHLPAR